MIGLLVSEWERGRRRGFCISLLWQVLKPVMLNRTGCAAWDMPLREGISATLKHLISLVSLITYNTLITAPLTGLSSSHVLHPTLVEFGVFSTSLPCSHALPCNPVLPRASNRPWSSYWVCKVHTEGCQVCSTWTFLWTPWSFGLFGLAVTEIL